MSRRHISITKSYTDIDINGGLLLLETTSLAIQLKERGKHCLVKSKQTWGFDKDNLSSDTAA